MATKDLQYKPEVHVAEVVRHGEKLTIPVDMEIEGAIKLLYSRQQFENTEVEIRTEIDAFVWDGALALADVLAEKYGWVQSEIIKKMFQDDQQPMLITVSTGPGETRQVPWGRFKLAGVDGFVETGYTRTNSGRFNFEVKATIRRKHEREVKDLFEKVRVRVKTHSIYKGKPFSIIFKDDEGESLGLPQPRFFDVRDAKKSDLVLPLDVENAIATNIFTPIERIEECRKVGLPVKRGALLCGYYGTGKTLTARIVAKLAQDNNITYVLCPRAEEFNEAVEFARQYQPAVVFCEDIDRTMRGQKRTGKMDQVLNTIDGIESKSTEIIVILTTNDVENVNKAMLRPGRLDAVIEMKRPDAQAVVRLLKLYGGKDLSKSAKLEEVGKILDGNIPAVIAEVVKRSKLAQFRISKPGDTDLMIGDEALIESANTMKMQLDLLKETGETHQTFDLALAAKVLAEAAVQVTRRHQVNGKETSAPSPEQAELPDSALAGSAG